MATETFLMNLAIESAAKFKIQDVISYLIVKGKSPLKVFNEVKIVSGKRAMNRMNVYKWYREFKNGRSNVQDDQRSGRTAIVIVDLKASLFWDDKSIILIRLRRVNRLCKILRNSKKN